MAPPLAIASLATHAVQPERSTGFSVLDVVDGAGVATADEHLVAASVEDNRSGDPRITVVDLGCDVGDRVVGVDVDGHRIEAANLDVERSRLPQSARG